MLYDKNKYYSHNEKKLLHKVKKHWVIISSVILMAIGGVGVTDSYTIHADNDTYNNKYSTYKNSKVAEFPRYVHKQHSSINRRSLGTNFSNIKRRLIFNKDLYRSRNMLSDLNDKNNTKINTSFEPSEIDNKDRQPTPNKNNKNIPKYITAPVVTEPLSYIKSLENKVNPSTEDRTDFDDILANADVQGFANDALTNHRPVDIKGYIQSAAKDIGGFNNVIKTVDYAPQNWDIYKQYAMDKLDTDIPDAVRTSHAINAVYALLDSKFIHPQSESAILGSLNHIVSILNSAADQAQNVDTGVETKTIPNPADPANNVVYKHVSDDPNIQLAYEHPEYEDPLFNQNYHYNDPEGSMNDIQSILPHYNNGKIDYWDVFYLWNPNPHWMGDQWYHARTKDFKTFYGANDPQHPDSIKNAAIPDPYFKINGKSAEVDSTVNKDKIPWGYVATGSTFGNNTKSDGTPWLTQDKWGNPIKPNARLALFSTFWDYTIPNDGVYLAYSNDGKQYHPYSDGPAITTDNLNLPNNANFRDSFVTPDKSGNKLIAYIAGAEQIYVLTSENGANWTYRPDLNIDLSRFPEFSDPNNKFIVETPQIKEIDGQPIMIFGYQHSGTSTSYDRSSRKDEGMAYLTGYYDQDGVFKLDDPSNNPFRYLDQGFDNYAGSTVQLDNTHDLYLGWIGNWGYSPNLNYANYSKGGLHQGTMTIPRILTWDSDNKTIESDPVEPGAEIPVSSMYINRNADAYLTSDGKSVINFNHPVSRFNLNLSRSKNNQITLAFNHGELTINRHDSIENEMNMNKTIKNIGTDRLDNLDLYIDNASIEAYIPRLHKFYTIMDLDYNRNNPYQISINQSAEVNEYKFDLNKSISPNYDLDSYSNRLSNDQNEFNSALSSLNASNSPEVKKAKSLAAYYVNNYNQDYNKANNVSKHLMMMSLRSINGDQRFKVYTSLENDYNNMIENDLSHYEDQIGVLDQVLNPHTNGWNNDSYYHNGNLVTDAFVVNNGIVYHLDNNGRLSRNTDVTIEPNITYHFDNNGAGEAVPFQDSINLSQPAAVGSVGDTVNGLLNIVNNIKNNPNDVKAFHDLLYRISFNHLPDLDSGVAGIPSTDQTPSTDAQSPYMHTLLRRLSDDLTTVGQDLHEPILDTVGGLISNDLLKNLWGIGYLAGGPFTFSRVINNLLPNPNFKALRKYQPYVEDAMRIYDDDNARDGYDDLINQINQMIGESADQQKQSGKAIANDLREMGQAKDMDENSSAFLNNVATAIDNLYLRQPMESTDANVNFYGKVVNYFASSSDVLEDSAVAGEIQNDQSKISNLTSQASSALNVPNSNNSNELINDMQSASNVASDAEDQAISAISYDHTHDYSMTYNDDYSAIYDNTVANSAMSNVQNMNLSSAASEIADQRELIASADLAIDDDFAADDSEGVSDANSQVSIANQAASTAYSIYYSASVNAMYHNPATPSNYSHIYQDYYSASCDGNMIKSCANKVAGNSQATSLVNSYANTINGNIEAIRNDFQAPNQSGVDQATAELSSANNAVNQAYQTYSSANTSAYSHVYSDSYTIDYDGNIINRLATDVKGHTQAENEIDIDKEIIDGTKQDIQNDFDSPINHISAADSSAALADKAASNAYNAYYDTNNNDN